MNENELEVKFYVKSLRDLEARLRSLGANRTSPRNYELNLRFDTPNCQLSGESRVLRLRQESHALMTYKGPSQNRDDVTARQEIEFQVSDFQAARRLLEALGYQVFVSYEKYRTTYEMDEVKITLDEMPFGKFCEVEGPDPERIRSVADRLELDWSTRIMNSYLGLFTELKAKKDLEMRDLTFGNFADLSITAEDLRVKPAEKATA